jgi:hypothetical protein
MNRPKFPSEQQGGYDPIPTHPEPFSPQHTTEHPEEEPRLNELPKDERHPENPDE